MSKKNYTLKSAKEIAQQKNGKCLSNTYNNVNSLMEWKCHSPNHKSWKTSFNNILKGSWCPECRIEKYVLPLKIKIKENDGEWISGGYVNSYTKIRVKCSNRHSWSVKPASIMRGKWCSKCAHEKKKKKSSNQLYQIVKEQNGEVLKFNNNGSRGKAKVKCKNGHEFTTNPSWLQQGTWCPKCAIEVRTASFDEFKKIVNARGGVCLSEKYSTSHQKLLFRCINGHTWYAKPNAIKNGTWCPKCNISVGENLVKLVLEYIFKEPFIKSYPKWLKSKEGNQLELDGYCEKLKIAFEHQGIQHLKPKGLFSKSFERRVELDLIKRNLCERKGVRLIEIEQAGEKRELAAIIEDLKKECNRLQIDFPSNIDFDKFNKNSAYINDKSLELLKIKKIADQKNGKCLSELYGGHYFKLDFECKEGHQWKTDPATIKRGSWCPQCARASFHGRKPKYNIKDLDFIALQKGGKCISRNFQSGLIKMEWECIKGHRWIAVPYSIIRGSWCPVCAISERNLKKKLKE